MKKLLKLLLVRRPETKDKWWHRLALVLIYGSTIVGAIFLATLLISEEGEYWVSESYTAYSFEQGYATADGKEIDCKFTASNLGDLPPISIFNCGDLSSDSEFLERYSRARGTYDRLQEVREEKSPSLNLRALGGGTRKVEYDNLSSTQKNKVNDKIMVELIQSGELDDIKVKRDLSFDYASFFGGWGIYVLLILAWLIFWESIVYRTILFIVYGKKTNN